MAALHPPDKQAIEEAHKRIEQYVQRTPIITSSSVDEMAGCKLYFKCENFQKVGAFKARGAMNAALQLSGDERLKGLATHSSGNHGQAVARAAKILNTKAFIVMPRTSPEIKKRGVTAYGGEVVLCEPNLSDRERSLREVIERTGAAEIHPFNNYDVISGQASVAKEMIEDIRGLDILVCPVGGGGLLSGTALAAKYFSPETRVIGAEPAGADDAFRSLKSGKIEPATINSIADGLLATLGEKTFSIIRAEVKEIITATDEEIVGAMRLIWERMKIIVEPSAAVALAIILNSKKVFSGKQVGVILSGGNVDLDRACKLFTNQ